MAEFLLPNGLVPCGIIELDLGSTLGYIDNGVRLGWLIDTTKKQVEIYRQGQDVEVLESPTMLSGEEVLPEFLLDLNKVW